MSIRMSTAATRNCNLHTHTHALTRTYAIFASTLLLLVVVMTQNALLPHKRNSIHDNTVKTKWNGWPMMINTSDRSVC